jgi:formylglycine-generating enzyme required for sulfatase activity
MRRTFVASITVFALLSSIALADTFGTGSNQFTIDFVTISGSTNPTSGYGIVNKDYRMGTYEITNAQYARFASNNNVYWTGDGVPSNRVTWFEAAQFVNYLNTSTGNTAAYKFNDSTFTLWDVTDTGYDASNPFRNSNAKYFLPTENEWVKAAYWNGTILQNYATKAGESVYQGNGTNGGWNYYSNGYATNPYGPWTVGSGSQELNGTYDMMGNVREWMENPYVTGECISGAIRGIHGGSYEYYGYGLASYCRSYEYPGNEPAGIGFRVASIPEPCSLMLLGLGGLALQRLRRIA